MKMEELQSYILDLMDDYQLNGTVEISDNFIIITLIEDTDLNALFDTFYFITLLKNYNLKTSYEVKGNKVRIKGVVNES